MNSEIKTTRDLIAALNELEERLPEFEAEELVEVYDLVDSMADISRNKRMKSLQSQITALTAERDEARSNLEKQIEITYEAKAVVSQMQKELAALARRSIASREEVVGLLKWCWMMFDSSIVDLAADQGDEEGSSEARRILEIVEGK